MKFIRVYVDTIEGEQIRTAFDQSHVVTLLTMSMLEAGLDLNKIGRYRLVCDGEDLDLNARATDVLRDGDRIVLEQKEVVAI